MELRKRFTEELIFELECNTWEELLKGALKAKISFHSADFRGADFSDVDFRYSDFSYSDFSDSDFSGSNFCGSDFSYSDFRGADFRGSNFSGADFSRADFSRTDFCDSNFRGSDFSGSQHQYKIGNMREWKSMQLDTYMIGFNDSILTIGCQQNTIAEWKSMQDEKIKMMDAGALEWWKKWKDFIFQAIELSKNENKTKEIL
jgi:hypothetical protein